MFKRYTLQTNKYWFNTLPFLIALAFIICSVLLSFLVVNGNTSGFDSKVEQKIQSIHFRLVHDFFDVMTGLGEGKTLLLVALGLGAFLLWRKLVWEAGLVVGSYLIGVLLVTILKNFFQRTRPGVLLESNLYSYPSGHVLISTCVMGVFLYVLATTVKGYKLRLILNVCILGLIISIGLSVVYNGLHSPTEALAGYLIAGAYLFMLLGFYHRYSRRYLKKSI